MQVHPIWLVAAILSAGCGAEKSAESSGADLIVYGRVWTGDSTRPWAQGVAVKGDTIAAVGDSATVARLAGSNTRVIANGKALVAPGFMDGHAHFLRGGFQLSNVDLRDAATPQEFVARIKALRCNAAARRVDPGRNLGP